MIYRNRGFGTRHISRDELASGQVLNEKNTKVGADRANSGTR